jgi:hypothetical protein
MTARNLLLQECLEPAQACAKKSVRKNEMATEFFNR